MNAIIIIIFHLSFSNVFDMQIFSFLFFFLSLPLSLCASVVYMSEKGGFFFICGDDGGDRLGTFSMVQGTDLISKAAI